MSCFFWEVGSWSFMLGIVGFVIKEFGGDQGGVFVWIVFVSSCFSFDIKEN